MKPNIAPLRDGNISEYTWEGDCAIKPWSYQVTAVIPVIDTVEQLKICIELLQLQTIQPYIVVIDTGSTEDNYKEIEKLRSHDVEVHSIRMNGTLHPSDFPAVAMDLAFSMCRSEFLFATHSDCFVKRINLLEEMVDLCIKKSPVVGYEITKRMHKDWKGMVSHTCSIYHMPTMDKIGFGWSLRRLANCFDIKNHKPDPSRPNWPDTELLGNYILRKNNITPELIGTEENFVRTYDDNIDHFRSYTSGRLYSREYYNISHEWYLHAKKQALERIENWRKIWDNKKTSKYLGICGFTNVKKEKNQLEFIIQEIDSTCRENINLKDFKIPDSWNLLREKNKESVLKFKDIQEKLAFAFYTLSENIVKYAKFNLIDQDDAIQEGVMICFEKVDRFDPSKGKAFNYMTTCILNHFKQLYRSARNYNELKRKYSDFAKLKLSQNLPYNSKNYKKHNVNNKT